MPILCHPDPKKHFILEADASYTGVGAVLSQRANLTTRFPLVISSLKCLSPAEKNYDVGNRELLAIKLALEEWRQWLEGTDTPFLIWTNHKNFMYLRDIKCLQPRQAWWSLFFTCFSYVLTFHPDSKNVKPDALFCQFSTPDAADDESIIPPSCVVGALTWTIERESERERSVRLRVWNSILAQALWEPFSYHPPSDSRYRLGYTLTNCRHPGISCMLSSAKKHFWWLSMMQDVKEFVAACSTCARNKLGKQPPAGHLQPLLPPADHGPISLWTLSLTFHLKVTQLYSRHQ